MSRTSDVGTHVSRHINPATDIPPRELVGSKAFGLYQLPLPWTLPFVALDVFFCGAVNTASKPKRIQLLNLAVRVIKDSLPLDHQPGGPNWGYFLRSSFTDEDIAERGQQISEFSQDVTAEILAGYLDHLVAQNDGKKSRVAIVVQIGAAPDRRIHFSNERRVSKTQNEWVITQDIDQHTYISPEGCNSTKALTLAEHSPLALVPGQLRADLRLKLRGLGKWATKKFSHRVHFELVLISTTLFVVQVDAESDLGGIDPRHWPQRYTEGRDVEGVFRRYDLTSPSGFAKLDNLRDFQTETYAPPHRLYFATARDVLKALECDSSVVLTQLRLLTSDRLVIREDFRRRSDERELQFNLFRTDTIDARRAIRELRKRIRYWAKKKADLRDVVFIIHAFVPAIASAWAMYSKSQQRVRIHALWGLPDGLQYLTPDEYEVELATGHWSSRVHFKEFCLLEEEDGSWRREAVSLEVARHQVLPAQQQRQIAKITYAIGKNLNSDVHIMFFCGLPREAGMGDVLPWYRAREFQEYEAKREKRLKRIPVRNLADLKSVPLANVAILLDPSVEDYRDNSFLKKVAAFAVSRGIPVELRGSPLAHSYYVLRNAGCTVFTAFAPSYERVRSKKEFGKLVRDGITEKISRGGEKNISFALGEDQKNLAFFAKVFEESIEVIRAGDQESRMEELADLYEVFLGWVSGLSFDLSEIQVVAAKKRQKLGGFTKGEVLVETGLKSQDLANPRASFDAANRVRRHGRGVAISAGRLSFLAKGETLSLLLGDAEESTTITLSINDDGELVIVPNRFSMEDTGQLELGL